jgi:hypothetical protein
MTYVPDENRLGIQPIAVSSATQNHALGTIIRAADSTYGDGEFIYLKGVGSTVVGSVVTYGGASTGVPTYQTALAAATAGQAAPLAVAMSANLASQYGWYQISGMAVAATNGTLTAGVKVYLAGSGQLTSTQANGVQVDGAVSVTATGTPASGQAVVEINRPSAQGQIV